MTKPGRNDPCPCGSGAKYKRCCLPLHQRARAADPVPVHDLDASLDRLDAMSNRVVDLIAAGRHAEAERLAVELQEAFPEAPDGLERLAEVHAAAGDRARAAAAFRRAAAFHEVHIPDNVEVVAWLRDQADRMDRGLDIARPQGDLDA